MTNHTDTPKGEMMREARRLAEAYGLDCAAMKGREESPHALRKLDELLAFIESHLVPQGAQGLREAILALPCKPYDGTDAYTHYCRGFSEACTAAASLARAAGVQEVGQASGRGPRDWLGPMDDRCYQCKCATCGNLYFGEKRSCTCRLCAATRPEVAAPLPTGQDAGLRTIHGIKLSRDSDGAYIVHLPDHWFTASPENDAEDNLDGELCMLLDHLWHAAAPLAAAPAAGVPTPDMKEVAHALETAARFAKARIVPHDAEVDEWREIIARCRAALSTPPAPAVRMLTEAEVRSISSIYTVTNVDHEDAIRLFCAVNGLPAPKEPTP